jgi:TolB-like protein/class 3 adenylate cyclase
VTTNITNPIEGESGFDIAHVLCTDIVGYSKLTIDEQSERLGILNDVVRGTESFKRADAAGKLLRIPTGDGMVLVFFTHPQDPAECAVQIATELKSYPEIPLRMGIHSGPVNRVSDVNERSNVAGAGINIAQRVMDCGDAGHILVSKRVAEDLSNYSKWRPQLHDLGQCEVKHGVKVDIVNLYNEEIGNPALPKKRKIKSVRPPSLFRRAANPVALAVLVALACGGAWLFLRHKEGATQSQLAAIFPGKSIAVLPFRPLVRGTGDQVLEAGMADTLITKLSSTREFIVPSLSAVQKFDDQKHDPVSIGRELRVNSVLEGTVQKSGDRIRVTARLIKTADGSPVWGEKFDEKFTDVFDVQDSIAQKVATALAVPLNAEEQKRLTKRYTDDTEAYQSYLKGRFYWGKYTEEGFRKSIDYFKQAIEKDPNYALAYAGLADTYSLLGDLSYAPAKETFDRARAYAEKAIALDNALGEAHLSLGIVKLFYDWDLVEAEKELRRAKELIPNNPQVYHFRGHYLELAGRLDEAIAETKRGVDLDPTNLIVSSELGWAYYQSHQFDKAIAQYRKTLEMDQNFIYAAYNLAQAYEQKGMYREALAELERAQKIDNWAWLTAEIACVKAATGEREEAIRIMEDLKQRATHEYIDESVIAGIPTALGDKDQAFAWLEKAYQVRAGNVPFIKVEPKFDPLRSDPRFIDLLRRMGLN